MNLVNKILKFVQQNEISDSKNSDRNNINCPVCNTPFEKPPKRKIQCSNCKEYIYVRTTQDIFNSDLLTEEDALAADFYKELEYLGATKEDFIKTEKELGLKWNIKPKSYDVVWGVSNKLILHPPNIDKEYDKTSAMLYNAKMVTFSQALYQLRRGHNPNTYLVTVNNYDLQLSRYGLEPPSYYEISSNQCCDICNKHNGDRYTKNDIDKKPILPLGDCENFIENKKYAWCTCRYMPHYSYQD